MSLEQAIQENTAAIRELIAALGAGNTGKPAAETATVEEPKAEKPAKEKKQSAPAATPESKAGDVAAADPEPEASAQQDEAPAVVSYDECAASITKLAKGKGRSAAVEVLGEFGLKTLQDAKDKPEVLAKVKAAADTALEG